MAKSQKKTTTRKPDPWFNFHRHPKGERALQFIHEALHDLEKLEKRKRARRTEDRNRLWRFGHVLLANVAYYQLNGARGKGLVVPRAKSALAKVTRYQAAFPRTFPVLLNNLERFGYLTQTRGKYSGFRDQSKRTTIRPGRKLVELIEKHQLAVEDFGLDDDEEVIILKRRKRNFWDQGEPIGYEDNTGTNHFRSELKKINSWLENANIAFDCEAASYTGPVDTRARRLYRYFAGDFKSGGRLFCGFWENLPKRARLLGLRIEGEAVVELDYAQLNPTLAYANVGGAPPQGDAYALPGLEKYRDGVKKVFNALLFDRKARTSFPKGVNILFPPKTKIGDVIQAIREKHPMLGSVLSTRAGYGLMFLESEIMMGVLRALRDRKIVGLPVFDAVIVKASDAEAATSVMKAEFKKRAALEIEVRLEEPSGARSAQRTTSVSQAHPWDF